VNEEDAGGMKKMLGYLVEQDCVFAASVEREGRQ